MWYVCVHVLDVVIGQHQGWARCVASLLKYFPSLPGSYLQQCCVVVISIDTDTILRYCLEAVSNREEVGIDY